MANVANWLEHTVFEALGVEAEFVGGTAVQYWLCRPGHLAVTGAD